MSFMKRESLSAIIQTMTYSTDDVNNRQSQSQSTGPIGKVISRPTKSIFVRHGTKEQQIIQLETEIKHAHMQLSAERARVSEMETTLKTMINEKFTNQSSIISKLQDSQNALRTQLQSVIHSKMALCEETAKEIDKLRTVIRTKKFSAYVPIRQYKNRRNNNNNNNNNNNSNNNSSNNNNNTITSKVYNELDFPHGDRSRIDLRSLSPGDSKTLPNPFASVDLQYTGYIVDSENPRDRNKWNRFIDENTSKTIFETKLGSNENIIGLEQAVLSMSLGEKAIVWVPSRLGYGSHGAPNLIPPNADIVFELTLVSIQNDNEEDDMVSGNESPSVGFSDDDPHQDINTMNNNNMNGNMNNNNNNINDMHQMADHEY